MIVSVASFYCEPMPQSKSPCVRIRGMATLKEHRDNGYGRRLVEHGLALSQWSSCKVDWCNARISAAEYYFKLGFRRSGDEFELPNIGPHVIMMRPLHTAATRKNHE